MPIGSDSYYQEMLDNAKNYNKRICIERRQRLPFLDSQTGVAQNHSGLCIPYRYRGPGRKFGQIYTYPSRRWKKKSSLMFNDYPLGKVKVPEVEVSEETPNISSLLSSNTSLFHSTSNPDITTSSTKLPSYPASNSNSNSNEADLSSQQTSIPVPMMTASAVVLEDNPAIVADWEVQSDNAELENEKRQTDSSDYEETYVKKRKKGKGSEKGKAAAKDPTFRGPKRGSGKGRGKKEKDLDGSQDKDKPYSCEFCSMKYKTRPGLSYHMNHSHNKAITTDEDPNTPSKTPTEAAYNKKAPPPQHTPQQQQQLQPPPTFPPPPPPPLPPQHQQPQLQQSSSSSSSFPSNSVYNTGLAMPTAGMGVKHGNKYCDFCLGDENENKKTGFKEEMVSCADCGRSGHPSCLQFSANMIISVKRYPWQCIECKSCGICGTSDNDDQLLFCDDCDRGYHMYCLKPPLSEPPEGSWSCHLCITEFYNGSKTNPLPN